MVGSKLRGAVVFGSRLKFTRRSGGALSPIARHVLAFLFGHRLLGGI